MAEIVNLRAVRKRKALAEKERKAAENRVLHGRTKAERLAAQAAAERTKAAHEGHRRESPDEKGRR